MESDDSNGTPTRTSKSDAGAKDAGTASTSDMMKIETAEFLKMVVGQGYTQGSDFTEVTSKSYASAVGAGAIRVWVTTTGADAYWAIDPATKGSKEWLPRGSLIVRAVLDAAGNPTKLTLMAKGSIGSNPKLGDYWFAVTTPQGVPLKDDAGVGAQAGVMTECHSCHLERAQDDFLFGVPSASRAPHP